MNTSGFLVRVFSYFKKLNVKMPFTKSSLIFIFAFFFFLPSKASAQCAMCRAVLESEENKAIAEGVNNGIVYLMAIPYILVAVLFYFVYKKMKN